MVAELKGTRIRLKVIGNAEVGFNIDSTSTGLTALGFTAGDYGKTRIFKLSNDLTAIDTTASISEFYTYGIENEDVNTLAGLSYQVMRFMGESTGATLGKSIISKDTIIDLSQTAPIDDTTKEKQKTIYKATGKRAWLMDNDVSREMWRYDKSRRVRYGGKVSGSITNKSPASIALALGFTGLIKKGYEPVERTDQSSVKRSQRSNHQIKEKRQRRKLDFVS